jgi:hypothetical protein
MNIDRHNYEEYFLLYIDNELNGDQKKQVELFVRENPDLEEELVMLRQSRLIPDDSIVFDKKHLLMKEENTPHSANPPFINLNNYEEWLIMYVDDELSSEERVAVEKFADAHPHVREEMAIFLQTKLQPEEIVFPNKETLYRREKTVRVISMQWWKIAIAAILIISAGVSVYSVLINKNNNTTTSTSTAAVTKTDVEKKTAPKQATTGTPDAQQQLNVIPDKHQEERLTVAAPARKESNEKEKIQEQPGGDNNRQLAYSAPGENPIQLQPATVEIDNTTIEQPKVSEPVAIDDIMHKQNISPTPVTNPGVETPDNSSKPDDAAQYASNTENKKFRGFFRKATRILERTTSIDAAGDDKVLIGGMAINLK